MHLSEDVRILSEGKVAIIGGSGGMGKLMARLLRHSGASIRLCGRNLSKVKYAARKMGLKHGKIGEVEDADILLLSIPFNEVLNVFKSISGLLKHNSLVVDISSVKVPLVNKLTTMIGDEMEYLSLHPLFSPSTKKFIGQRILAIEAKEGPKSKALKEYLKGLELIITPTTPEEHDRMMAITQVSHHFPLISLSKILTDFPVPEGFKSRSFYETVKRIRGMSKYWKTILEIQKYNPYAAAMRERYMEAVSQLLSMKGPAMEASIKSLKKFKETYPG